MTSRYTFITGKYTRLILLALLCIASVCGYSQQINGTFGFPNPGARGVVYNGGMFKNEFYPPIHDTTYTPIQIGAITKRPQDTAAHNNIFYTYTGVKWDVLPSTANLGLQEVSDINKVTTRDIEVNGLQTNDSLKSIAPLIVGAPNWITVDSSNYPFSRMGPNQGIAWDGNYRYLDSNSVIYKVDANYNIIWANRNPFSGLDSTDHMGDFFWNKTDGHLYVPMETINTAGNVFSGQKIGVFDTADGHRISVITASDKHPSEITALTKYDSSIAAIDFYVGGTIFLRSFTDASIIDSIDLATPIPGAQGITFDSAKRIFYIISETKLYSVKEDGSEVLVLMDLPYSGLGHVGEGLEMINGNLSMLVASRGNSLSKVYTAAPSAVSPTYTVRASIDGNGEASLKKASSEFLTLASSGANKVTLSHPSSVAVGSIQFDKNGFYFGYNAIYGTKFTRQDTSRPSFALVMSGKDSSFQVRVSRKSTAKKVSFDKAFEISADGATYIKPAGLNVERNNQVLAPFHVTAGVWQNFRDSLNPTYTLADFQHNTTTSMLRMQNTGTGGTSLYHFVTNSANSSGGGKYIINFDNSTNSVLATFDSANQSLRIKSHIGVGASLNKNPSGLGTVSLSVSDKSTGGRAQIDMVGNRTATDQAATQIAFWNNTTRFAAVSALRGSTDTTGYITFSTKDTGTNVLTERVRISQKGLLGIGTTPTALVDIAANAATASQIRFRDGITPTTLTKGYMWFDGTALNFYNGSTTTNILVAGTGTGYKVYSALLNQAGTSAPTATVLENTMGETFTFAYDDVGRFIITSPSNKFISNKTFMVNGNPIISEGVTGEIALSVASTSAIVIKTTELAAGAAKNGVLINSPIEIRVYN